MFSVSPTICRSVMNTSAARLTAVVAVASLLAGCGDNQPVAPEPDGDGPAVSAMQGAQAGPEVKLTASDGAAGDGFGLSVSVDGDRALVGAGGDDDNGSGSGSAYVFARSGGTWTQEAKLLALDGAAGDGFGGSSVSVDGNRAVIGASLDDDNGSRSGSAYVFERSGGTWAQVAKLTASDGAARDFFGTSVGVDGDRAVVGAFAHDDNGIGSGSAYVFARSGGSWTQEAKLLALDGASGDIFGSSVAVAGDRAVVGAPWDDDNGGASGSAYVFERNGGTWAQEAKLTASDGELGDEFGRSVSLDGDRAVVGAPWDDDNGGASGSAYVFERNGGTWAQEAKLTASDGASGDLFGSSVAVDGDRAVVGAYGDDDNGSASGSTYVFERNGGSWAQEAKLTASDGAGGDRFGWSVSVDGQWAVAGARGDDDNGNFSGSAYVYDLSFCLRTEAPNGAGPCHQPGGSP